MINRVIILSSLFLLLSSTLQGSMKAPTPISYNQTPDKQALIDKIFLYCFFNDLLNIDSSHDDLCLIAQLIKKDRKHILLLLQPCLSEKNLVTPI